MADTPHAVLIRAGTPLDGMAAILERRGKGSVDTKLLGGPGSLAKGLGIVTNYTGTDLVEDIIWIEDQGGVVRAGDITAGPRIGVDYAGEDAKRPYRFVLRNEQSLSGSKRPFTSSQITPAFCAW